MGSRVRKKPKHLADKLRSIREHLDSDYTEMSGSLNKIIELFSPDDYKKEKVNLRRSDIWKYEAGEREPNLIVLLGYAKLAKISTDVLIDDRENLRLK